MRATVNRLCALAPDDWRANFFAPWHDRKDNERLLQAPAAALASAYSPVGQFAEYNDAVLRFEIFLAQGFCLNETQPRAVRTALQRGGFSVVWGLPGTGKI